MLTFDSNTSIRTISYNFIITKGSTFNEQFIWTDDETDTAIDITNVSFELNVYDLQNDAFLTLTDNDNISKDGLTGTFNIKLSYQETLNLPVGRFDYNLLLNNEHLFLTGYIDIIDTVTK